MDRLRALPAEHAAVRDRLLAVDDRRLPQLPPPRRALVREEVARVRAEAAHLALLRHLEALGDGAVGLELGHVARGSAGERAEGTGGSPPVKEPGAPPGASPPRVLAAAWPRTRPRTAGGARSPPTRRRDRRARRGRAPASARGTPRARRRRTRSRPETPRAPQGPR